jgi:hypothetical protein
VSLIHGATKLFKIAMRVSSPGGMLGLEGNRVVQAVGGIRRLYDVEGFEISYGL